MRLRWSTELTAFGSDACNIGGGSKAGDGVYIFCKNCSAENKGECKKQGKNKKKELNS